MSEQPSPPPPHQTPRPIEEPASPQGMELREVVALLLAGKWWVGGITALGLALGLVYAFLATPIYRADAMLQIQQQNSALSSLTSQNDILSSLFGSNTHAQAEIQIMTSRAVLDPVIRRLHLNLEVTGAGPSAVGMERLDVPASWMGEHLQLTSRGDRRYVLSGPDGNRVLTGHVGTLAKGDNGHVAIKLASMTLGAGDTATLVHAPVQDVFQAMNKRLTAVEMGHDTGIVQMTLTGKRPAHIRRVLNAVVAQYLQQNVAAYSAQARRSLKFVNKQLPQLKKQMNRAETRLTAYQVKHNTVSIDEQAKALLQEFNTLEGELSQLRLAQAALGQQYTRKYPAYAALKQQQASVKQKLSYLQSQLKQLPKDEQGYVRLKRDAKVYTTLYTQLLGQQQDLGIAAAGSVGNARVVDKAVTPLKPVKPNKRLVVILGFLLGLGAGVGVVFLRRALSRGMADPLEIEQRFGVPMYAVVSHSGLEAKLEKRRRKDATIASLLAADAPHDPAVEALRSLRTSIDMALRGARNRIVGLSGPAPRVGKSFVAANLAHLAAAAGKRTLLVDCDLRKGHLHRYLGLHHSPGIAELLMGTTGFDECVKRDLLGATLDFVPTGAYPPNPAELLLKHDIGALLERIGEGYDLVLVDLPPLLSVSDPVIAMRGTGANLIVLRAGRHAQQEVSYALTRLQQNGIAVAGFLLNDLTRATAYYGYGYYGGYSYEQSSKRT